MNANSILQSDVLDILFENRNKKYGAYILRKEYNKRLMTAIGAMFSLVAIVVVCLSFKAKDKVAPAIVTGDIILDPAYTSPPPKKPEAIVPIAKPRQEAGAPKPPSATIQNTNIVITKDETTVPTVTDMEDKVISTKTTDGAPAGDIVQPQGDGNGSGKGNGNDNITTPPVVDDNAILKTAEFMPEYPGGASAMTRFLLKNLRPMTDDEERTIKVLIRFIVDKTGAVTGFEIVGSGGQEYDKEVLRVMKKMPNWKPGSQNGHPVNVYMTLPVVFQTQSE